MVCLATAGSSSPWGVRAGGSGLSLQWLREQRAWVWQTGLRHGQSLLELGRWWWSAVYGASLGSLGAHRKALLQTGLPFGTSRYPLAAGEHFSWWHLTRGRWGWGGSGGGSVREEQNLCGSSLGWAPPLTL